MVNEQLLERTSIKRTSRSIKAGASRRLVRAPSLFHLSRAFPNLLGLDLALGFQKAHHSIEVCRAYRECQVSTFLAVPLVSRDEAFGALNFRSMQVNAYTDRDLALAERVGQQIAGAIANAKMYAGGIASQDELRKSEEAQRRLVQEAEVLAEIGRTISSSLNIDEVYERFAEHVRTLIPFDRIELATIDAKREEWLDAWTKVVLR